MIDAHLHLVDFLQKPLPVAELAGVLEDLDGAVVFGLPVKKKWATSEPLRPTYYLDDNAPCGGYSLTDELVATLVAELPESVRDRVAPLICGFDPTDLLAVDHLETMLGRHDCWRGVGEVLLRHDDLTELTYGENARAAHPGLDPVLEICAERGWPMLIHQDASSAGRADGGEYVGELVDMVRRHRRVPIVWAHAGVSRRIHPADHAEHVGDLLDDHANLHVDVSWVVHDVAVDEGRLVGPWARLLERHPDRFVVGSDAFGDLSSHDDLLGRWDRALAGLTAQTREAVVGANARRLYWRA